MEPPIIIHHRFIHSRKAGLQQWRIAPEDKRALLRFLDELALGQVNKGRRISESRQCKYLDVLRTPLEFLGKPTPRLTVRDIEKLEQALISGQVTSHRGRPYLPATQVDMRRALKVFLRWRLGSTKAAQLTGWLDTLELDERFKGTEVETLKTSLGMLRGNGRNLPVELGYWPNPSARRQLPSGALDELRVWQAHVRSEVNDLSILHHDQHGIAVTHFDGVAHGQGCPRSDEARSPPSQRADPSQKAVAHAREITG